VAFAFLFSFFPVLSTFYLLCWTGSEVALSKHHERKTKSTKHQMG
jgi:hypothetical protein